MMGMDQDDIVLAPWTTIKYRVSGTSAAPTPTERRRRGRCQHVSDAVNSLSQLYPDQRRRCTTAARPRSRRTRRSRCASPTSTDLRRRPPPATEIPPAIAADHRVAARAAPSPDASPDDFRSAT